MKKKYMTVEAGVKIIKKMIKTLELVQDTNRMVISHMEGKRTCPFPDPSNLIIAAGMHKKDLNQLLSDIKEKK